MEKYRRGHQKKSVLKKLKKRMKIALVLLFIAYSFVMNTSNINGSMKTTLSQKNEGVQEKVETVAVKNFELTVNTDLTVPSNVEAEDIDKMLSDTALEGLGASFVQAEKDWNVNALYMMGLACLESGYGESNFAKERNNLYGWNAVDSNPEKASSFSSKEEATLFVAENLAKNYLSEEGAYYEGKTARNIDVHYCTDKKHADKICSIVSSLREKLD